MSLQKQCSWLLFFFHCKSLIKTKVPINKNPCKLTILAEPQNSMCHYKYFMDCFYPLKCSVLKGLRVFMHRKEREFLLTCFFHNTENAFRVIKQHRYKHNTVSLCSIPKDRIPQNHPENNK